MRYVEQIADIINDNVFEAEEFHDECNKKLRITDDDFFYLPLSDKLELIREQIEEGEGEQIIDLAIKAVISNEISTPNVFYNWGLK